MTLQMEGAGDPELLSEQSSLPSWTVTGKKNKLFLLPGTVVEVSCAAAEEPYLTHHPCFSVPEIQQQSHSLRLMCSHFPCSAEIGPAEWSCWLSAAQTFMIVATECR